VPPDVLAGARVAELHRTDLACSLTDWSARRHGSRRSRWRRWRQHGQGGGWWHAGGLSRRRRQLTNTNRRRVARAVPPVGAAPPSKESAVLGTALVVRVVGGPLAIGGLAPGSPPIPASRRAAGRHSLIEAEPHAARLPCSAARLRRRSRQLMDGGILRGRADAELRRAGGYALGRAAVWRVGGRQDGVALSKAGRSIVPGEAII